MKKRKRISGGELNR